jgi:hypothetical protein
MHCKTERPVGLQPWLSGVTKMKCLPGAVHRAWCQLSRGMCTGLKSHSPWALVSPSWGRLGKCGASPKLTPYPCSHMEPVWSCQHYCATFHQSGVGVLSMDWTPTLKTGAKPGHSLLQGCAALEALRA